ncbi:L-rhamnose mutarotase [Telmatospirillum sp.]|uniref:L-rhamnose mutarotase n=1 Tax=Telmatospirillum sp. TaxID=2079197 RepID=UPI002841911B|nr:L-rhamnose mutarotase [Telmatospirillum sp.]MDR3439148.1 L-rhamnose mutarotase [Telmatospirillum sp.]
MIRKAFVMQIFPNMADEYRRRHDNIWPELCALLKKHGAHDYSIFLDEKRNLLFATVSIESEERWADVANTDICRKWWDSMVDLMATNADHSPVCEELSEVFYLR